MLKLKLGNIVARVVLGESWRERTTTDYLHAEFARYLPESHPQSHFRPPSYDDDDDGSSIISISTNATFDDLPGTGRTVDTRIFQPMGRRIERLAMRLTISSLHPACIAQYIGPGVSVAFIESITLRNAIAFVCSNRRNGTTIVAGLKGLVKQTQSDSIDRSAAALAALIRVSLGYMRKEIFANVSRLEPIFHLETLVRSHPDKKWFLLLVKLARETLIAIRCPSMRMTFDPLFKIWTEVTEVWPSQETVLNLRQRLIRVLNVYKLSGYVSPIDTIGEACAICAEAASTYISRWARGDAYMHILDTVYFTVIFILRSIIEVAMITTSKHICMVLRTLACWMDAIVHQCIYSTEPKQYEYDMDLLKAANAFRSVVLVDVDTKYMLLPESFKSLWPEPLFNDVFPRRNREENKDIHHIKSLIEAAKQRTWRLLRSFDALEIEVRGCTSQNNYCTTQLKDPIWISPDSYKIILERARRVQVQANSLTETFREARRRGLKVLSKSMNWPKYQIRRTSRHKWGQYLRSNMDWDWDLGTCMRRLFKVEPTREGHPPSAQCSPVIHSEIDVDAEQGMTWRLEAQGSLPKQVQIAYKTENGETQYMSFVPAIPCPGRHPVSKSFSIGSPGGGTMDHKSNPVIVQDDSDTRNDFLAGEQETEDGSSSYSDEDEQFVDCESISFGDLEDNLEV